MDETVEITTLRLAALCQRRLPAIIASAALACVCCLLSGCGSSATEDESPFAEDSADTSDSADTPVERADDAFNLDDHPVEAITMEEFFRDPANLTKYLGKRVTWQCVIESVDAFHENPPGFSAAGYLLEFEGLTEPVEDKDNLSEYAERYYEYSQKEIRRVSQTVTFFFNDRPSHEQLKDAKGKRATISGMVAPSPINSTVDLNHCRVVSVDN